MNFLHRLLYFGEKLHCYGTVCILTPGFMIFEMVIVRPEVTKIYQAGVAKQTMHISISIFLFLNVVGNMMMSILHDCKLKSGLRQGEFCDLCQMYRPPKAWHCKVCNACILTRDHHCFFFSRCIGLYNRRYYLLYIFYIHLSMIYSCYHNYHFISSKFEGLGFAYSALCIINPLLRYLITERLTINDLYVLLFLMNVGLVVWSALLMWFHLRNTLKGLTAREYRNKAEGDWRENFLSVFGTQWYLAIVCPFADSPTEETTFDSKDQ